MKNPQQQNFERGGLFLPLIFIFLILVTLPFIIFGAVIEPNEIGIRVNHYSIPFVLQRGIEPQGLEPGMHWEVPMLSSIERLPRGLQIVALNELVESNADFDGKAIDIPTTDGSKVQADVTLLVRLYQTPGDAQRTDSIKDKTEADDVPLAAVAKKPHGGPMDAVNSFGITKSALLGKFSEVAGYTLKDELRNLSTADFYDPVKRERAALVAQEKVDELLGPKGFDLWATLIRRYTYAERKIDDQIFSKNLQDQTERLNAAKSQLAGARADTEKELASWDAKIRDLEVTAQGSVRVTESEGKLLESKKIAEGDLLASKARSEVDREKAQLLGSSSGAKVYLAREMVGIVRSLEGGIVTGIDPFNLNEWVDKLLGERK